MKKIASFSLMFCFAICAVANAQDTRMTPGMKVRSNTPARQGPGRSAQDGEAGKGDSRLGDSCEGEECPIMVEAMASLPKMVFKVGDEETCCHMTATRMARESDEKIVYLVGKKRFGDSRDAFESLVKQTEIQVKRYVTPKVCNESGATTIAGETCGCTELAAKMTELVGNATKDLKMTYVVGEKEFEKYHDARRYSKKMRQKGMYVVSGEKFEEELEARLALAHKKFRLAVTAIQSVKASQSAATSETSPSESSTPATKTETPPASDTGLAARDG